MIFLLPSVYRWEKSGLRVGKQLRKYRQNMTELEFKPASFQVVHPTDLRSIWWINTSDNVRPGPSFPLFLGTVSHGHTFLKIQLPPRLSVPKGMEWALLCSQKSLCDSPQYVCPEKMLQHAPAKSKQYLACPVVLYMRNSNIS